MKKILLLILFGTLIFAGNINVNATTIVGGDFDEYGCKGSAGYMWSEYKQECVRPWEQIASQDELLECSSYYDGCNTCMVNEDGTLGACTLMYCSEPAEPKCLEERIQEYNFDNMCSDLDGETNDPRLKIVPYCNINGIGKIFEPSLKSIYNDITGEAVYLGGSKYFDESTGGYKLDLMTSDYKILLAILDNKSNFTESFIDSAKKIKENISSKLDKTETYKIKIGFEIGNTLKEEAKMQVDKYISRIKNKSPNFFQDIISEKIQQIQNIVNKLENKTNKTKKEKLLIPVLKYCAILLGEENYDN